MAKKRDIGSILECLRGIAHHTEPLKVKMMVFCGQFTPEYLEYRFRIVKDDCLTVSRQLELVRQALVDGDNLKALALLDEKTLPHGHEEGNELESLSI